MALLDDVGVHLQGAGLGLTLATNLFLGNIPDPNAPDTAVVVYGVGGAPPIEGMGGGAPAIRRPQFQVVSRSLDYEVAQSAAEAIFSVVTLVVSQTVNGVPYLRWECLQDPLPIGVDANDRHLIAVNCRVHR